MRRQKILRRAGGQTQASPSRGVREQADPSLSPPRRSRSLGQPKWWRAERGPGECHRVHMWWVGGPWIPPAGETLSAALGWPRCPNRGGLGRVVHLPSTSTHGASNGGSWWTMQPASQARFGERGGSVGIGSSWDREPPTCLLVARCPPACVAPGSPSGETAALAPQPHDVGSPPPTRWPPPDLRWCAGSACLPLAEVHEEGHGEVDPRRRAPWLGRRWVIFSANKSYFMKHCSNKRVLFISLFRYFLLENKAKYKLRQVQKK